MIEPILPRIKNELEAITNSGLFKNERNIVSPQSVNIKVESAESVRDVINLCANNYLGFADNPEIIQAATDAMNQYGFGMSSVRFICGTTDLHKQLEQSISNFLETDDSIIFAACFDANGGVFEPLLTDQDAIISDSLNHASLIDGIRLCKAKRFRFINNDMVDLEAKLTEASKGSPRTIIVATDGVFSMDGIIANMAKIRELCDEFSALLLVDDCHATGVIGSSGKGSGSFHNVKPDIITSTLGKSLGGAAGGFIAASQPIIDLLRQKSRPYLFSNSLPPAIVGGSIKAIELCIDGDNLREQLHSNSSYFRTNMVENGFEITEGEHPIIPVMLGDAKTSQAFANRLDQLGVYVSGFFYPVVPKDKARIRVQMSSSMSIDDLDIAIDAFKVAGRELGII